MGVLHRCGEASVGTLNLPWLRFEPQSFESLESTPVLFEVDLQESPHQK